MIPFELSKNLNHTWFIDLDGTIFVHDRIYFEGRDQLLPGVKELWKSIPDDDIIVITSARDPELQEVSLHFLTEHGLRYDHAIFGIGHGERIVINDRKPEHGLETAIAWNVDRNQGFE